MSTRTLKRARTLCEMACGWSARAWWDAKLTSNMSMLWYYRIIDEPLGDNGGTSLAHSFVRLGVLFKTKSAGSASCSCGTKRLTPMTCVFACRCIHGEGCGVEQRLGGDVVSYWSL